VIVIISRRETSHDMTLAKIKEGALDWSEQEAQIHARNRLGYPIPTEVFFRASVGENYVFQS